ncbi:CAMP-dependent protein kinase regulatory [Cyclospora cayetanensis]|uniref:cAMP-dependent protein kinase regulatory n=1 Tax=Cyclospora cayetanensis TaxID=88456 RepID=A0A1D3DA55_9EIME|nr:CAMP-dependent protein kinase regulatory [Cyclospora cayetanensis]
MMLFSLPDVILLQKYETWDGFTDGETASAVAENTAIFPTHKNVDSCKDRCHSVRLGLHEQSRGGVRCGLQHASNSVGKMAAGSRSCGTSHGGSHSRKQMQKGSAKTPVACFTAFHVPTAVSGSDSNENQGQATSVIMPSHAFPSEQSPREAQVASGESLNAGTALAAANTCEHGPSEMKSALNQVNKEVFQAQPLPGYTSHYPADSAELLGLSAIVSTVGSWVAAAFQQHESDDEDDTDTEDHQLDNYGYESRAVIFDGQKGTEKAPDVVITDTAACQSAATAGSSASSIAVGESMALLVTLEPRYGGEEPFEKLTSQKSQPDIMLHLCGQPAPILWTPDDSAPLESNEVLNSSDLGDDAKSFDAHFLHVQTSSPSARGGVLNPPVPQTSLHQLADDIEMWLLNTATREQGNVAEESACSSESSDEATGEQLLDIATVSAYLVGKTEDEDMRRDSDDGLAGLHEALAMLRPLEISSATPSDLSAASPLNFSTSYPIGGAAITNQGGASQDGSPLFAAGGSVSALKSTFLHAEAVHFTDTLSHKLARGRLLEDFPEKPQAQYLSTAKEKRENGAAKTTGSPKLNAKSDTGLEFVEFPQKNTVSRHVESAGTSQQASAGKDIFTSGEPSANLVMPNLVLEKDYSSELTPEEAAAKESEARSLGNRIWAFFGGGAGVEAAASGSDAPTEGEAVEETIPFEDPAVVQRDDHRAFPNETQLLLESIKKEPPLEVLSPQQQKYVATLMRREVVPANTSVAEEGGDPALMWCSSGEFDVTQAAYLFPPAVMVWLQGFFGVYVIRTLKPGDFFGLEELVSGEKLKCTLKCRQSTSECALWVLDREMFLDSVKDMLTRRQAFVTVAQAFLHKVPLVRDLPEEQIAAVAKACKVERFSEGQTVFKMGFHGDMLCFIYKGEAITQKPQDDGGILELARQGRGEYFGEMALIRNTRRTASVVAGTELLLFCLDKESFENLLAPVKEKMAAKAASSYKRQDEAPPTEAESKPSDVATTGPVPGSRDAGEACVKKRTRKSSLALLNYSKIRDQEKQAEEGPGENAEDKPAARWRLAEEPGSTHEPPPLSAPGGRSCIKRSSSRDGVRTRKSSVRFDEDSLLPSDTSSDEG